MARTEHSTTLSAEEIARLRRRYPRSRVPRPVVVALVGIGAVLGLTWLVWVALFHSRPPVAASVSAYTVQSDRRIAVTMTVDRRDPGVPVVCRVQAKAADFAPVGELVVPVPADTHQVVDVTITMTTLRRATSASVAECSVP